jgi:hypothetical protein
MALVCPLIFSEQTRAFLMAKKEVNKMTGERGFEELGKVRRVNSQETPKLKITSGNVTEENVLTYLRQLREMAGVPEAVRRPRRTGMFN